MNTGAVRMLHFLAFASSESDIFTLAVLCFEYFILPFTSQATSSLSHVVLCTFGSNSLNAGWFCAQCIHLP